MELDLKTIKEWRINRDIAVHVMKREVNEEGHMRMDDFVLCGRTYPEWMDIPKYTTNPFEFFPLLGKDYDIRARNGTSYGVTIYRPSEHFDGHAETLGMAVCIAALRQAGVEIE